MDKTILNGNKLRLYNQGNSQSGSIQYTDSKLSIGGNSAGSGVLITDGKLYLKSGATTTSIIYDASTTGVTIADGLIHLGTGSNTSSISHISDKVYIKNDLDISKSLVVGTDISSPSYLSGFAGNGFKIDKDINNRYVASFDDLWVRGSMNVYEMVINQIRATNGSLWVSDAAKAISASYDDSLFTLYFETGSILPFISGDIIRSKRWLTGGNTVNQNWDVAFTITAINHKFATVTYIYGIQQSYHYTSSTCGTWQQLAQKISVSGSQWVRVGSKTYTDDRRGAIYLTSNDIGGPFLDVYDGVDTVQKAIGGISQSVTSSNVKVRLGKLTGIVDSTFNPSALTGYGLYSDNVYLRGTISATAGTFSGKVTAAQGSIGGWNIDATRLYSGNVTISSAVNEARISIDTEYAGFGHPGMYFGYSWGSRAFSLVNSDKRGLLWLNDALEISSSNFKLDSSGNISASNVILGGTIRADTGYLGGSSGWQIKTGYITSSGIQIKGGTTPAIKIGASAYSGNGIWLGKGNYYSASFWNTSLARGLKWDGQKLIVSASNFSLDTNGKISANEAVISGSISSSAGQIGGWTIDSGGISSVHSYGTVSITRSGTSNLSLTDTYGNFTYSAANSNLYTSSINKYLVTREELETIFNRYESGITISQANSNQGFGVQINHLLDGIIPLFVFTVSGLTIGKEYILQSRLQSLTVHGLGTPTLLADYSSIHCWITPTINPWQSEVFLGAENPLWCEGSKESNNLVKQYRMTPTSKIIYLWVGGTIAPVDYSNISNVVKFTFSGFRIDSFKQYTELSQKGLLVFNSPENYLQLSSENDYLTNSSKGSLGLLNVTELHVNGTSINDRINNPISVFNGGTGTNSFANHQFLWYDSESKMITASGFSSSSGGGSGMTNYNGVVLTGANVISDINITSGVMTTASRALTAADINAVPTSRTVTGTGLLGGGGDLAANKTITHNIANGAYHLPANGSAGQLIMRSSGKAGSGSWTSNIQTNGTASFASITASAGFTSSTGNIAVGGSITSSQAVKAKYFDTNPNYGYKFGGAGSIKVEPSHGTALDLQDFSSLKIGNSNNYGTSNNTFLQGVGNEASGENIHIQGSLNEASGENIHIQGYNNSGSGAIIHIEGSGNRAEVDYGHTQGYNAIGHIVGSKTFANGSMDGQFPDSTTQVSTIVLYAYDLNLNQSSLINQFYPMGVIDFNRAGQVIKHLHISFFLNVMITYDSSRSTYAYQQTFTYNNDGNSTEINTGAPYGDVSATAGISPGDIGEVTLDQDDVGIIHFSYEPKGTYSINSVIVKVEMIEHIVYTTS